MGGQSRRRADSRDRPNGPANATPSAVPVELVPGVTLDDVEAALRARPELIDDLMRSLGELIREATLHGRLL